MCQIQGLKYGYVLGIGPYETKIYARFVGCRKTKIEIEIYRFQINKEKKRNLWVEGRKMTERWGERAGTATSWCNFIFITIFFFFFAFFLFSSAYESCSSTPFPSFPFLLPSFPYFPFSSFPLYLCSFHLK